MVEVKCKHWYRKRFFLWVKNDENKMSYLLRLCEPCNITSKEKQCDE